MESPLVVQLHQEQNDIQGFQWYMNELESEDDEYDTFINHTSPAGERLRLRVAYMTSGTEKKLKFTAVKPEDMAEFLDILFGTNQTQGHGNHQDKRGNSHTGYGRACSNKRSGKKLNFCNYDNKIV